MSGAGHVGQGGTRVAALTGGTGFLGRYIALALARAGWRLRLLVRRDPVHPQTADLDPEIVLGDLDDDRALEHLCRGAGAVVHAAGLIKAHDRSAFFAVNEGGSARLAAAAARVAPDAGLVVVSSLAARAPTVSDYAASKRAGEEAARRATSGAATVLRPPVLYGPWDRETLALFRLARGPVLPIPQGADEARLCFLHAADAAAAAAAFADRRGRGGTYELSDPRPAGYGWAEIARTAAGAVGGHPRIVRVPAAFWRGAGAVSEATARLSGRAAILTRGKVREMLHADWSVRPERQPPPNSWRPVVDLERGFAETAAWYRRCGWLGGGCVQSAAHAGQDGDSERS